VAVALAAGPVAAVAAREAAGRELVLVAAGLARVELVVELQRRDP
jgi:hypothetical protein